MFEPIPTLLLSGGFDSALILHQYSLSKSKLRIVHMQYENTSLAKRDREEAAVDALVEKFKPVIRDVFKQPVAGLYNSVMHRPRMMQEAYAQMVAAALNTPSTCAGVLVGTLVTDQNIEKAPMEQTYHGLLSLFDPGTWLTAQKPKVYHPLRDQNKANVLQNLPTQVAKLLTFCERATVGDPCGICGPCVTFYSAILDTKNSLSMVKRDRLLTPERLAGWDVYLSGVKDSISKMELLQSEDISQ